LHRLCRLQSWVRTLQDQQAAGQSSGWQPASVLQISAQDPAQVRFAEHNHMVETFPSDRADQSLDVHILPRRSGCDRPIAHAYGLTMRIPSPGWNFWKGQQFRKAVLGRGVRAAARHAEGRYGKRGTPGMMARDFLSGLE
jgi:hypothetical protein